MLKTNILLQSKLKEILKDIYIIGQESETIKTSDFIKLIENELLSLIMMEKGNSILKR